MQEVWGGNQRQDGANAEALGAQTTAGALSHAPIISRRHTPEQLQHVQRHRGTTMTKLFSCGVQVGANPPAQQARKKAQRKRANSELEDIDHGKRLKVCQRLISSRKAFILDTCSWFVSSTCVMAPSTLLC